MGDLILSNILHRPVRSIVSVLGVGLGVALLLLFAGLASGGIRERAERETNVGAEIIFRRSGSAPFGVLAAPLSLHVQYADKLRKIEGVEAVTPVGQYVQSGVGGLGFRAIEGIDFDSYAKISGIRIVAGRMPTSEDEVIVDVEHARNHKEGPGNRIEILGNEFRIAGIYEPESGPRVKMSLSKLQSLFSAPDHCSVIYVKCKSPAEQETVAQRIQADIPKSQIIFTRDLPRLYSQNLPMLGTFLRVLVGLALVVSTLTILLGMYTAVSERTREIGMLKSLGASQRLIVFTIEKEALLLSTAGTIVGFIMSYMAKVVITNLTTLVIKADPIWLFVAGAVGMGGGMLGALYPALRAARMDAVVALGYG